MKDKQTTDDRGQTTDEVGRNPKSTLVIHHSADFDGLFCREIARKIYGSSADYVGWDYGQPTPEVPPEVECLVMLDLAVPGLMAHPKLVWIDHHKSSILQYTDSAHPISGWRLDGVAACRLAWQWWFGNPTATVEDFRDRRVREPLAVRMAGEYDIWDKRDPDAETFQHGLRSRELTPAVWADMLYIHNSYTCGALVRAGQSIQYARTQENASIIQAQSFRMRWEGLNFLCCNHARFNSQLFTAALTPEDDACLGFCWAGQKWKISLYHAPGKEVHDLSVIAAKHGGGGHRGACGFTSANLPFFLS